VETDLNALVVPGKAGHNDNGDSSKGDDDIVSNQRRWAIHGAADPPSNLRSKQKAQESLPTGGNTVPQVQFLTLWTARASQLFAIIVEIIRQNPEEIRPERSRPGQIDFII
jgi:hypothetical protein